LARRLPSIYPTLCCKEIRVTPKIRVLPLDFVQNAGLGIFRPGGRSLQCRDAVNKSIMTDSDHGYLSHHTICDGQDFATASL